MDYQSIKDILLSDRYYRLRDDLAKLINDSTFMQRIVIEDNPLVFDRFVKMCEFKIDTYVLYKRRNSFIKKKLKYLDNIDFKWVDEYIIGYFFQDNYYNVSANFYQMVSYIQNTKKKLVNEENIDIYKRFIGIRHLSLKEKIDLFNEFSNKNIMEMFYFDMDTVRKDSHKSLVDASLKLNRDSNLYKKDISKKIGVDIYVLDGEKFFGFTRTFGIKRDDLSNQEDYIYSRRQRLGYSFSYISDVNIGTMDYSGENVTLFYDNINYKNIMYVHHSDLHAKDMTKQDDYLSVKENEIVTPNNLAARTTNYNEIYIKSNNEDIKPTALICYDKITDKDLNFAKKYNLAILVINKEKYKTSKTYEDDFDKYSYVI